MEKAEHRARSCFAELTALEEAVLVFEDRECRGLAVLAPGLQPEDGAAPFGLLKCICFQMDSYSDYPFFVLDICALT